MSGSKGGSTFVGPENDLGFSPVMKTGGKKTIDQVTVVKCKKCDILLGDKDIHYSQEEIDRAKAEEEVRTKKKENLYAYLIVGGFVLLYIVIVIIL